MANTNNSDGFWEAVTIICIIAFTMFMVSKIADNMACQEVRGRALAGQHPETAPECGGN